MDNDLRLATWNVRTLLRPGGLKTLTDVLRACKLGITAVQETRWPGSNLLKSREHTFYYSGKTTGPRQFGTGFVVLGNARDSVIGFDPLDERLCSIRVRGKFFNITLINAHAPTEEKEDDLKEEFYEKLQALYNRAPERDVKIILGDFNAKIGRETVYRPTIGIHSLHETSNDNGCRLIDFAVFNNMVISTKTSTKRPGSHQTEPQQTKSTTLSSTDDTARIFSMYAAAEDQTWTRTTILLR